MLWNLLFALSLLGVAKYGDYITEKCPLRNYACPTACDVDHKHYPRKECKDAKRKRDVWKKSWKTSKEKEKEEIEEYKDGEAKQEGKSDTTTVQLIQQFHKEAVGTDKSEGL